MADPDAPEPPAQPALPLHSRQSLARRLRLQQLMVFEQAVASGSLLAAAGELAMTQPAVSKSIQELEAQVGGALFVRGKRGVALTEFGRRFEPHAASVLAELRQLAETLNATQAGTRGQVVVGTLISASAALLPAAIERLRRDAPDVVVTVRVGPNTLLFPLLARGELDVVVGALPGATAVAGAERARLAEVELTFLRGEHHDRDGRGARIVLDRLHRLEAVHARHLHVQQDQVRRVAAAQLLQRPRPIGGLFDFIAVKAQLKLNPVAQ